MDNQNPLLILENGANTIKAGLLSSSSSRSPLIIPNAIVRSSSSKSTYIGHEFSPDRCKDYAGLHYRLPCERGIVVDWDAQKAVWDGIVSDEVFGIDTSQTHLIITEPYFNLPNIQDIYDQFMFEEYEFMSYYRCTPASLIPHGTLFSQPNTPPPECMLIIDSGFSFTHVVPILCGQVVWGAVKRIPIGGKLLTNHLKELISFRQWNMMDETFIMNEVKEKCCFVSIDYSRDLEICRSASYNPLKLNYILPDLSINRHGRILPEPSSSSNPEQQPRPGETDQILSMANERFAVPEVLFRPDDIGIQSAGLAPTIAHAISLLPADLQGMFWANIGLIGGCVMFKGFKERLMKELRTLAPVECDVVIYECDDPITEAYTSAYAFASSPTFSPSTYCLSRADYLEGGNNAWKRKFKDWRNSPAFPEPLVQEPELGDGSRIKGKGKPERERAREAAASEVKSRGRGRTGVVEDPRDRERDRDRSSATAAAASASASANANVKVAGRTRSGRSATASLPSASAPAGGTRRR